MSIEGEEAENEDPTQPRMLMEETLSFQFISYMSFLSVFYESEKVTGRPGKKKKSDKKRRPDFERNGH